MCSLAWVRASASAHYDSTMTALHALRLHFCKLLKALLCLLRFTCRLPTPGSEQLTVSFPFVAYSSRQQAQLLGTLPQSHTCANTLELPDYVEALTATEPLLMQEWQQAQDSWRRGGNSSSSSGCCQQLRQRCCDVLQDRLLVSCKPARYKCNTDLSQL